MIKQDKQSLKDYIIKLTLIFVKSMHERQKQQ